MALPPQPKPGEAPYDPGQEHDEDRNWFGKTYHLVWSRTRRGQLTIHKGPRAECTQFHADIEGKVS